jgi:hypothetical protein
MAHSQITPEQISIIRTLVGNTSTQMEKISPTCIEVTCTNGTKCIVNTECYKLSYAYIKRQSTDCPHVIALKDADGATAFLHTETMEISYWWGDITSFTQVPGLPVLAVKDADGGTIFLHTETMEISDWWGNITSFTQVPGLPVLAVKRANGTTRFLHTETMKKSDWFFSSWSVINPSHPHIIRMEVGHETRVYNLLSMEVLQVCATERLVSIDIVDGEIVVTKKEVLILPQSPR